MKESKCVEHRILVALYENRAENKRPADVAPCIGYEGASKERRRDTTPTISVRPAVILPFFLGSWEIVEKCDDLGDQLKREHHGDSQVSSVGLISAALPTCHLDSVPEVCSIVEVNTSPSSPQCLFSIYILTTDSITLKEYFYRVLIPSSYFNRRLEYRSCQCIATRHCTLGRVLRVHCQHPSTGGQQHHEEEPHGR